MPRTGRKHSGTGIYHVMLRGVNRQGVFEEPEDYRERWNQTCLQRGKLSSANSQ